MNRAPSSYEQRQLKQLKLWQQRPPGLLTRGFARAAGPATRIMQVLIPVSALQVALHGANRLAVRFAARDSILQQAGVDDLSELKDLPLEQNDALVERIRRQAVVMAAGGGALTGIAGAPGLVADIPALLTLSLHSIHRIGLCYGYDCLEEDQRPFAIGVFALASANSMTEKRAALDALRHTGVEPDVAAWRDGMERAAQRELSKEAAVFSLQNLSRQLGVNLGRRKAAASVPILGAAVGAAVNVLYIRDLARTAVFAFHQRRFTERGIL